MMEEEQQDGWKSYLVMLRSFLVECRRVIIVTKKPTGDEFRTVVKVASAGMLFIGLLGFLIMLLTGFLKLI